MNKTLIFFDFPKFEDLKVKILGKKGPSGHYIQVLKSFGAKVDLIKCVINKSYKKGKKPSATEATPYHDEVWKIIEENEINVVILAGDIPVKAVLGKSWNVSKLAGDFVELEDYPGVKFYATVSDMGLMYNPDNEDKFVRDAKRIADLQKGVYKKKPPPKITEIRTLKDLELLKHLPNKKLSIDCEWQGFTWRDSNRYTRTVQLGLSSGQAIVIVFNDSEGKPVMDNGKAYRLLGEFLKDKKLIGQNAIADGMWLRSFGVDIKDNFVFDTMLAEHLIDSLGPFGLEVLTTKYTNSGRYDIKLEEWKQKNNFKSNSEGGYGRIPDEVLIPYGAYDVSVLWDIGKAQEPELELYKTPVGAYPNLWEVELGLQRVLYEVEETGLKVDVKRLGYLITLYQKKKKELLEDLLKDTKELGLEKFNPNSSQQVQNLLFNILKLTPQKTTDGRSWSEVAGNIGMDDTEDDISPAADAMTLVFLQDEHPIVGKLLLYKRVAKACSNWLPLPKVGLNINSRGGGILGKMWEDGRLHPRFSQLIKTGRLASVKPNVQNWGNKSEAPLKKAFDEPPPSVRSIIIPPDDSWVLMEGDFKQAELFVLANFSQDKSMLKALYTPGLDMHDFTTIQAFRLSMMLEDKSITNEDLTQIAKLDSELHGKVLSRLLYISEERCLTRDEFKSTLRIAGKAVSFKIMYGSSARGIASGIKMEAGLKDPLIKITNDVSEVMHRWKTEIYPDAWGFLEDCGNFALENFYIENAWGRKRFFSPTEDHTKLGFYQREAQNSPIQGAVGGATSIAMILMQKEREKRGLNFLMCNQIHDAIQVYAPRKEVEETKKVYNDIMGNIKIPLPMGGDMSLDVDIEVMSRWGEE